MKDEELHQIMQHSSDKSRDLTKVARKWIHKLCLEVKKARLLHKREADRNESLLDAVDELQKENDKLQQRNRKLRGMCSRRIRESRFLQKRLEQAHEEIERLGGQDFLNKDSIRRQMENFRSWNREQAGLAPGEPMFTIHFTEAPNTITGGVEQWTK